MPGLTQNYTPLRATAVARVVRSDPQIMGLLRPSTYLTRVPGVG